MQQVHVTLTEIQFTVSKTGSYQETQDKQGDE